MDTAVEIKGDRGSDAPESWETADIEKQIQKLSLATKDNKKIMLKRNDSSDRKIPKDCDENGSVGTEGQATDINPEAFVSFPGVDPFLCEALQNPKERMTILRMEKDMDRFMRSQKLIIFEFPRIPSSYVRMIAHKVAQHYCLKTHATDFVEGEGYKVIAEKVETSRFPAVKLGDVPLSKPDISDSEKNSFKIKPRSGPSNSGNEKPLDAGVAQSLVSKSMEERKEEYERARARIFSSESSKTKQDLPSRTGKEQKQGEPPKKHEKSETVKQLPEAQKGAAPSQKEENRSVAIIRNVEKEKSDPDFVRNKGRFVPLPRYDPQCIPERPPLYGYHQPFPGPVNYSADFPSLNQTQNPPANRPLAHQQGMYGDPNPSSAAHHQWAPPAPPPYGAGAYWPAGMVPRYYQHGYHPSPPGMYPVPPPMGPYPPEYSQDMNANNLESSQQVPASRRS